MLNRFAPKCPVEGETKERVDEAFGWLIEEIGVEELRSVRVVLPTEECFPDPFDGSRASIRKMLERVCGYMDVDPASVDVRFYQQETSDRLHPLAADGTDRRGPARPGTCRERNSATPSHLSLTSGAKPIRAGNASSKPTCVPTSNPR